ncbi:MAG: hypothetical protein AB4368_13060 [Xenococcaceae cyanobacterium]
MSKSKKLGDIDTSALSELAANFPSTSPRTKEDKDKSTEEKDVTITLRIPSRIAKDLKLKAVMADKTQRELILEGLKLVGVEIRDEDIADRRKN